MDTIQFKKLTPKDYPAVTTLYNYYILNSSATYHIDTLSMDGVIEHFSLNTPDTYAYSIYLGKTFGGFCLLKRYSKKKGYLFTFEITIYLKKEFTHQTIGAQALEHMEGIARSNNIETIVAAICAENSGSIKLFEKAGYMKCGFFKKMGYKFNRFLDNVYYQKLL